MSSPAKRRWIVYVLAVGALVVQAIALGGAIDWYGKVTPKVLIDPDLIVSDVGLPGWDGLREGLRFPDRVLAVEGIDLVQAPGEHRGAAWDRAIERAAAAGRDRVHVRVESRGGERELDLALAPLDPGAWWLWAGALFLIAWLYVGAGLTAFGASPHVKLARTFAKTAVFAALHLFTLFDFHTSRALVPLFDVAFAMVPMCFFALALRLPDDVPLLERRPWIVHVLDALGATLALVSAGTHLAGGSNVEIRGVCTTLLVASFIFFAGTLLVRFLRARGERRQSLRVLLLATVPAYVAVGFALVFASLRVAGSTALFCATPVLALTPLASVLAFIRHDIWESRALLSRPLTRVVIAVVTCVAATSVGAFAATMVGEPLRGALIASALGASLATIAVALSLGVGDRKLFPSRAEYKPTIEQLSQELKLIHDPDEVARAVERTVRRWLPCELVEFVATPADDAGAPPVTRARDSRPISPSSGGATLELPVTFQLGEVAVLRVGKKDGGALFTSEDLDLLRTIANQAALALAYARSYAELEQRRKEEAHAWQGEKEALVRTVAAEIAHDVRYPINYFRLMFQRGSDGATLDAEDIETICDEVERLERLVARLRHLTTRRTVERRLVPIVDLVHRTQMLLCDRLGERRIELRLRDHAALRCDCDQVTQVLVNLVSNGLEAAGPAGSVGVEWDVTSQGGELVVWDTGPGFGDNASSLFMPWFTTKTNGTGLGLSITNRFVRGHGWSIDARRQGGVTRFVIDVPVSDIEWTEPVAAE
jgi:signal transduction histidine kinase